MVERVCVERDLEVEGFRSIERATRLPACDMLVCYLTRSEELLEVMVVQVLDLGGKCSLDGHVWVALL